MNSLERGTVVSVELVYAGSSAYQATSAGATTLLVSDGADFPEDGGQVQVGDEVYDYTSMSEAEDATGTLALSSALVADVAEDDRVDLYPLTAERVAHVSIDNEGDAVPARVPYAMRASFPEGVRDYTTAEQVTIRLDRGQFVIDDAYADEQLLDGESIDPASTIPVEALTDGVPPDESPSVTVTGYARRLVGEVAGVANHDAVTYQWHITDDLAGAVPDFGETDTLSQEGGNTRAEISTLADGTPLEYDRDYFVGVFAFDADGPAAFSGWAVGRMDPLATSDLKADSVKAVNIDVVDLLASGIRTADLGQRVEVSTADGISVYDASENIRASFPTSGDDFAINADVTAQSIDIIDRLNLRGVNNAIQRGAILTLASALGNPQTPPQVTPILKTLALQSDAFKVSNNRRGLHYYSSKWWVPFRFLGGGFVTAFDPVTGLYTGDQFSMPFSGDQPEGGICHLVVSAQQRWAALCRNDADGAWYMVLTNDSGTLQDRRPVTELTASLAAAVATDGTSLFVAQHGVSDTYHIWVYTPGTTASTAHYTWSSAGITDSEVNGLYVGNGDLGATRYVMSFYQQTRVIPLSRSSNTLSRVTDAEWYPSGGERVAGLAWDGTYFYTASRDSAGISRYTDFGKTASSSNSGFFCFTNYDSDATGGTHQTARSPRVAKAVSIATRRRGFRVTAPDIPDLGGTDDPDSVRVYMAFGTSEPAYTSFYQQGTPAPGVLTVDIVNATLSGTNPPADNANNFPGGTPAQILDSAGNQIFSGNSGFDSYTPVCTASGGGFSLGNGTITGRYKRIGNDVHYVIKLTFGSTTNVGSGTAFNFTPPPVTPLDGVDIGSGECVCRDISATALRIRTAYLATTTAVRGSDEGGTLVGPTVPFTWATGDTIKITGWYESS